MDLLWVIVFFCVGPCAIWHSATAVRTGIFQSWYYLTWKKYYVRRDESPAQFWFETLFFSFSGSLYIGLGTILLDLHYDLFDRIWFF